MKWWWEMPRDSLSSAAVFLDFAVLQTRVPPVPWNLIGIRCKPVECECITFIPTIADIMLCWVVWRFSTDYWWCCDALFLILHTFLLLAYQLICRIGQALNKSLHMFGVPESSILSSSSAILDFRYSILLEWSEAMLSTRLGLCVRWFLIIIIFLHSVAYSAA